MGTGHKSQLVKKRNRLFKFILVKFLQFITLNALQIFLSPEGILEIFSVLSLFSFFCFKKEKK